LAIVLAAIFLAGMAARTTVTPRPLLGTASASECGWVRHTKRVMKRVKRHGKVRRVVRKRHWWTCVPQAEAPSIAPPVLAPPPSAPAPEPNRLAVKSSEYYFVLSRPSVKSGAVTIELNNRGEDPHNLNLRLDGDEGEPLQIPETDSEQRTLASFDLPAGKYRLWCSLPEHEEKGMKATLTVE